MIITGAMKAQTKLVLYLNQHLKRGEEEGRRERGGRWEGGREGGGREVGGREGGREEEGRRKGREGNIAGIGWTKELAVTHANS